ncbi:MAG: bifunctional pyr operon transcriptional regulator/uracil phosphoribosyltransferase PyrR [Pseudomonadota bacterium]
MSESNVLLSAVEMDRALTRMAQDMLENHRGCEDLALVGIRTRGVFLAARIQDKMRETGCPDIPRGELDISLYRDDWTRISHHAVLQGTDIPFSIDKKVVILVDDVLYTGRTVRAALDAVMDFGRPARVELAVLADRGGRELPISADYVGIRVDPGPGQRVNVYLAELDGLDEVRVS